MRPDLPQEPWELSEGAEDDLMTIFSPSEDAPDAPIVFSKRSQLNFILVTGVVIVTFVGLAFGYAILR